MKKRMVGLALAAMLALATSASMAGTSASVIKAATQGATTSATADVMATATANAPCVNQANFGGQAVGQRDANQAGAYKAIFRESWATSKATWTARADTVGNPATLVGMITAAKDAAAEKTKVDDNKANYVAMASPEAKIATASTACVTKLAEARATTGYNKSGAG